MAISGGWRRTEGGRPPVPIPNSQMRGTGRDGPDNHKVKWDLSRNSGLECPPVPQYTVGQAADLLGVSADTVRRLADRGELKVARTPGGRRRLDGAALARYAQKRAAAFVQPRTD